MVQSTAFELFKPERLLSFSDGVFGVAITLLVIDLRLPDTVAAGDAALLQALKDMLPKLLIFVFTFFIVGLAWLGHHRKFNYIDSVNETILWLNLAFLLTLCLVPFATSVLSGQGGRYAFVVYAAVLALVNGLSTGISAYGLRPPFLHPAGLSAALRQDMLFPPFLTSVVFVIAGIVAFAGHLRLANWLLLTTLPIHTFFGRRARAHPPRATGPLP